MRRRLPERADGQGVAEASFVGAHEGGEVAHCEATKPVGAGDARQGARDAVPLALAFGGSLGVFSRTREGFSGEAFDLLSGRQPSPRRLDFQFSPLDITTGDEPASVERAQAFDFLLRLSRIFLGRAKCDAGLFPMRFGSLELGHNWS